MIDAPFSYEIVEPAAATVVTLAEAKAYLGQTSDHEDDLIESLIPVAQTLCEDRCGRHFTTTTVRLTCGEFPDGPLPLLRAPVREVVALEYLPAGSDAHAAVDPGAYTLIGGNLPSLAPKSGRWPAVDPRRPDAVRVVYKVGFGDGPDDADPAHSRHLAVAKLAVKWTLAGLYDQRSPFADGRVTELDGPTVNLLNQLATGYVAS